MEREYTGYNAGQEKRLACIISGDYSLSTMPVIWYPMGVVCSVLVGRKLTNMPLDAWRGVNELERFLGTPAKERLLALHPELDVDFSNVTDWNAWTHSMRRRFGCQVEFEE